LPLLDAVSELTVFLLIIIVGRLPMNDVRLFGPEVLFIKVTAPTEHAALN